jgi:TctA family transporter
MFIFAWLLLSIAAGMFAHIRRNRNGVGWFVVAFFLSPFVAFVLLAILQPVARDEMEVLLTELARRNAPDLDLPPRWPAWQTSR